MDTKEGFGVYFISYSWIWLDLRYHFIFIDINKRFDENFGHLFLEQDLGWCDPCLVIFEVGLPH